MTIDKEPLYWRTNKEWYRVNREKDCYELTDKAPERAQKSFEMWNSPDHRAFIEKEYKRICDKLGFIPSKFKAPDFDSEDDSWVNPFSRLTSEEKDFLWYNGYLLHD